MEKEDEMPLLLDGFVWGWTLKERSFKMKRFRIIVLKDDIE